MVFTFTAEEIFEMAEEIERNGAAFYREAAAISSDNDTKQLLSDMAVAEEGHLKIFQHMREGLAAQEDTAKIDSERRSSMYLQTMADARGWEGRLSPTQELTGNETAGDIIEIALNSEKESVVFYFGLKDLVSTSAGKEKVENIIIEELGHISALLKKLKSLV